MPEPLTSSALRRELHARNRIRAAGHAHELSSARTPCVLYAAEDGAHGNFLPASWRHIQADPAWRARLEKAYTGDFHMPRRHDRRRYELDCAASSDALLMNLFCYPGWLRRPAVAAWLALDPAARPEFGVRADLPMRRGEVDRTELDLRLGNLLVEAKLTEDGFGVATRERLERYLNLDIWFDTEALPRTANGRFAGYQIVRGALAAARIGGRFLLLSDVRRADLGELWWRVLAAVRSSDLRCRLQRTTWQELASLSPPRVQAFLLEKYGIEPHVRRNGWGHGVQ